jgi:diguanylate cyclase (GGDEF)-like protein
VRRGEALACRYGGDEFVLIMPSATATEALVRLEGLERRLAEHAAARTKSPRDPVTASIGIAEAPADGSDPAALIAAADEAMYRAKQAGGNRICLAAARPHPG